MPDDHPSAQLEGVFRRPFTEQVAFFRRKLKNLVPTERWDDIERDAHDEAFMVAGAAKADLLTDLAAAVDKAIAEGRGIEEFRKDFRAIVKRHGWTGWTGEGSTRGEAWRVGVIYRTNAYTSYSAGRRAQLEAGKFPFWVYRHGGSLEPRPEHLSWDGLVLPPGHPFWIAHYPPSDWGCSCYALGARSERAAIRLGGDPNKKLPADWNAIDPTTGAPVGVGRGWDYAPGASAASVVNAMAGKIRHWDYAIGKAFMDELPVERADALADAYRRLPSTADDLRRYAKRVLDPKPALAELPPVRTLGRLRSETAAIIGTATGGDVTGFDFSISVSEIRHIFARHGNDAAEARSGQRAVTPEDFATILQLLLKTAPVPDRNSETGRPVFVFTARIGGKRHQAAFELRKGRRTLTLLSYRIGR